MLNSLGVVIRSFHKAGTLVSVSDIGLFDFQLNKVNRGPYAVAAPPDLPFRLDYLPRMPRSKSVGIGCVGAGFIMAECHLVAYRAAGFQPVAIASRMPQHAAEVARCHRIETVHPDYRSFCRSASRGPGYRRASGRADRCGAEAVRHASHIRGILAQKPLGINYSQARANCRTVPRRGNRAGGQSKHAIRPVDPGVQKPARAGELGAPVLATIEMRAIPHWMPWQQRQGWVTLRIMSIHTSTRSDFSSGTRCASSPVCGPIRARPKHLRTRNGICLYASGIRGRFASRRLGRRVGRAVLRGGCRRHRDSLAGRGDRRHGPRHDRLARYPQRRPARSSGQPVPCMRSKWFKPTWSEAWFPTRSPARWPNCSAHWKTALSPRSAARQSEYDGAR